MKKSIFTLVLLMCLAPIVHLSAAEVDSLEWDEQPLETLKNRFDFGVSIGYSNFHNQSDNLKTTLFEEYNKTLNGGLSSAAHVRYNVTDHLSFRLQYHFRTTANSDSYSVRINSDSLITVGLKDNYVFHTFGLNVGYRFRLGADNLFLNPEIGADYTFFSNDAAMYDAYTQKSNGLTVNGSLHVEYFLSNHVGVHAGINYSVVNLTNNTTEISGKADFYDGVPDDTFRLIDCTFGIFYIL